MNAVTWTLTWQTAFARRRLFVLNMLIPLLLAVPLAGSGAPAHHAAAVYAVLFALFGAFGAAIPALRDAERGFTRRLTHTRTHPVSLLLGRAGADTCIDLLQLLPVALLVTATAPAGFDTLPRMIAILAGTLLFSNLLGIWIAGAARSIAEGALFCAVASLLLLHASGTFRTPAGGSAGAAFESIAPFRALHEILLETLAGAPAARGTGALAAAIFALAALTILAAPLLLRALTATDGRG